jgi:hypothetical protein
LLISGLRSEGGRDEHPDSPALRPAERTPIFQVTVLTDGVGAAKSANENIGTFWFQRQLAGRLLPANPFHFMTPRSKRKVSRELFLAGSRFFQKLPAVPLRGAGSKNCTQLVKSGFRATISGPGKV